MSTNSPSWQTSPSTHAASTANQSLAGTNRHGSRSSYQARQAKRTTANSQAPGCLGKWLEFIHRPKLPPEDSILYRVVSAITLTIAVTAALNELEWPLYSIAIYALTFSGYVYSYRFRFGRNIGMKLAICVFMFWLLFDFFNGLAMSLSDPRIPIAKLLLFLHAGHCFDVPRRRDLNYSLVVGLVLMAFAGVLSASLYFGIFLSLFTLMAAWTLYLSNLSACREGSWPCRVTPLDTTQVATANPSSSRKMRFLYSYHIPQTICTLLLFGVVIYCCLPKYEGLRLHTMPMSLDLSIRFPRLGKGEIINPAEDPRFPSSSIKHSVLADDYAGFNPIVDLFHRGTLSDELVMKVRSSRWSYYRGLAFTYYDGSTWQLSPEEPVEITSPVPPLSIPTRYMRERVEPTIQVYHIERLLPNVIFASYQAWQLYFPSDTVYTNISQNLTAPFPLEEGMVYSVMGGSRLHNPRAVWTMTHPNELNPSARRRMTAQNYQAGFDRYLQLPQGMSPRLKELALKLTKSRPNNYLKAAAICLYLRNNYAYQNPPPPFQHDKESTEQFLFNQKRGNCQQFASSLAVLCRAANIPSRFVTGYLPGTYNPITGYYEVKGSDAHAWVEIFQPTIGWVDLDATPSTDSSSPTTEPKDSEKWMIGNVLSYLKSQIPVSLLEQVGLFMQIVHEKLSTSTALTLLVVIPLAFIAWIAGNMFRSKEQELTLPSDGLLTPWHRLAIFASRVLRKSVPYLNWPKLVGPVADPVCLIYYDMLYTLKQAGYSRQPQQTPREFAKLVTAKHDWPEVSRLTDIFEIRRYGTCNDGVGAEPVDSPLRQEAERCLVELQAHLKGKS